MKDCDTSKKGNFPPLFHVTDEDNLPGIEKDGLVPSMGELTEDAVLERLYTSVEYAGKDLDEEFNKIPDYVFATDVEGLPTAIYMIKNWIKKYGKQDVFVIGINNACASQFNQKEVASPIDFVSKELIPPKCLCKMSREQVEKMLSGDD